MRGVLLDADILSLFAKVDALPLLGEILKCDKLPITPGAFNEIMVPLTYGYEFPNRIRTLRKSKGLHFDPVRRL